MTCVAQFLVKFMEMLADREVFHAPIDKDHLHRKIKYESPLLLSSVQGLRFLDTIILKKIFPIPLNQLQVPENN